MHISTLARNTSLGAVLGASLLLSACGNSSEPVVQPAPTEVAQVTTAPVNPTAPAVATSVPVDGGTYATDVPRFWRVTNVSETLNVRAQPSTSADILRTFENDARHIFATGELATADGREWRRISFDQSAFGWVATEFLAPDTHPNPPPDTAECYLGIADFGRIAALIDFDGTTFTGVVRTEGQGDALFIEFVNGTLTAGSLGEAIVTDASGAERVEQWDFRPEGVTAGARFIGISSCDEIAIWAMEMFPLMPAS